MDRFSKVKRAAARPAARNSTQPLMLLALGLLITTPLLATAYPAYFLQPSMTRVLPAPSGPPVCGDQPAQAYGRHPSMVNDVDTVFTLKNADGNSTATYCPGQTYNLQIKFPVRRLALVTTSLGTFPSSKDTCAQRLALDPIVDSTVAKSATYTVVLAMPCSATGTLTVQVTSAATSTDSFKTTSFSASQGASCSPCSSTPAPSAPIVTTPAALSQISADMVAYMGSSASALMCAVPTQASAKCSTSSLGYKCSKDLGSFTLHWTLGGCPPINACTQMSKSFINTQTNVAQQMLHVAVTASTSGYVALGFAKTPGEMAGNDAVIGWASAASTRVSSYYLKGTSVSFDDAYSDSAQWLVLAGVVEGHSETTLCFTRPITAPSAITAKVISTADDIHMHYAFGARGVDSLQQHTEVGKMTLNLATNQASVQGGLDVKLGHGILMAIAWILLAPMGIMFARHKYLLNDRKLGEVHLWFITHRGIQMLAVALFIISFIVAMVKLSMPEGRIGEVHAVLGYLLVALAGCQVLGTFIRPKPGTPHRRIWNLFHWNMGLLSLLTAIANVYIGIYIYSDDTSAKMLGWFISVSAVLVLYFCTEIWLQLAAARRENAAAAPQPAGGDKPSALSGTKIIVEAGGTGKV